MGGDRLALLPKGTSRKKITGKKLLCGVGKRKVSSSWVSDFRGHSWSGPCSSLCNPTGITKTIFCQLPLQGFTKCNLLRAPSTKAAQRCLWPIQKATYGPSGQQQLPYLQQHGMARWGIQQTHGKINNFCPAGPIAFENCRFAQQIYICSHAHWTLPGFCSFPQALWKSTFLLHT